jgi:hypothetical protein
MGLLDGKKWSWVLNCPLTLGHLPYNVKHVNSVKVKYMVSFSVDTKYYFGVFSSIMARIQNFRIGRVAQLEENMHKKCKALSSNFNTDKTIQF